MRVQPSLAEVEIDGILGPAIDHETHAEVDTNEYIDPSGIGIGNNGELIVWFDNGDFITYGSLNFGPSGTTNSLLVLYADVTMMTNELYLS